MMICGYKSTSIIHYLGLMKRIERRISSLRIFEGIVEEGRNKFVIFCMLLIFLYP